jgi:hypothetical protein
MCTYRRPRERRSRGSVNPGPATSGGPTPSGDPAEHHNILYSHIHCLTLGPYVPQRQIRKYKGINKESPHEVEYHWQGC